MTVYVLPPEGWAPTRMLTVRIEQLGYRVDEVRFIGTGEVRLVLH